MIISRNSTASKGRAKILRKKKYLQEDNDRLQDLRDEDNKDKGDNNII